MRPLHLVLEGLASTASLSHQHHITKCIAQFSYTHQPCGPGVLAPYKRTPSSLFRFSSTLHSSLALDPSLLSALHIMPIYQSSFHAVPVTNGNVPRPRPSIAAARTLLSQLYRQTIRNSTMYTELIDATMVLQSITELPGVRPLYEVNEQLDHVAEEAVNALEASKGLSLALETAGLAAVPGDDDAASGQGGDGVGAGDYDETNAEDDDEDEEEAGEAVKSLQEEIEEFITAKFIHANDIPVPYSPQLHDLPLARRSNTPLPPNPFAYPSASASTSTSCTYPPPQPPTRLALLPRRAPTPPHTSSSSGSSTHKRCHDWDSNDNEGSEGKRAKRG